jgi:hypothetical protein
MNGLAPSSGLLLAPLPSALLGASVVVLVVLVVVREVLRLHREPEDEVAVLVARVISGLLPAVVVLMALRLLLIMY